MLHRIRRAGTVARAPDEIEHVLDLGYRRKQARERVIRDLDAHIAGVDRALVGLRRLRRSLPAVHRAARRDGHDAGVCRITRNAPDERVHV